MDAIIAHVNADRATTTEVKITQLSMITVNQSC